MRRFVITVAPIALAATVACAPKSALVGTWRGTIAVRGTPTPVQLSFGNSGSLEMVIELPQGNLIFLGNYTLTGDQLQFKITTLKTTRQERALTPEQAKAMERNAQVKITQDTLSLTSNGVVETFNRKR